MDDQTRRSGQVLLAQRVAVRHLAALVARAVVSVAVAYTITRCGATLLFRNGSLDALQLVVEIGVTIALASIGLAVTSAIPIRRDLVHIRDVVVANETELREQNQVQTFQRRVQRAFDMAETESELYEVAGLALKDAGPGAAEILVADASNAHVRRVVVASGRSTPGCAVVTPQSCPAVRVGQTLRFGDPNGLDACPRLRERGLADDSVATCVPINILGTPSAVLHAVCAAHELDDAPAMSSGVRALEGVGNRFGQRLGMMRAISQSKLQAETDPLTGLLNRRAMENQIRELRLDEIPFALAMVDLDHFKDLNDTYGHDTGDRALRLWSRIAKQAMRDSDLVARYGGEEFVVVMAGADVETAAPAMHRLRQMLHDTLDNAELPSFTFSVGLVDSTWSSDLTVLLASADRALMQAKTQGRDRLVIDDPSDATDAPSHHAPVHPPASRATSSAV